MASRLAVRVLAAEDHNRDLFHRLARRTLLRHPVDAAERSPLGAAEHELLMLVFAARTGARVAEPVMAYPVAGGGALVATVEEDSRALSAVRDEELTDQLFAGVWRSVALLQQHRLGHGSLRPEHILVAPDGKARFSAFARAQLNAPPEVLGSDLVDLLATTAVRIGPGVPPRARWPASGRSCWRARFRTSSRSRSRDRRGVRSSTTTRPAHGRPRRRRGDARCVRVAAPICCVI